MDTGVNKSNRSEINRIVSNNVVNVGINILFGCHSTAGEIVTKKAVFSSNVLSPRLCKHIVVTAFFINIRFKFTGR